MKKTLIILFLLILTPVFSQAKNKLATASGKTDNPRVKSLSGDDLEMYNSLTKEQQKNIEAGVVEPGYNAWMIKLAIGEPYYRTEHHPVYKDYEEVWLYTKLLVDQSKNEEKIIDPVTNWPSIHRVTRKKTCKVDDFFLLFDRGVVNKIVKDTTNNINGECEITTQEEFIPIVDGKPKTK